MGWYDYGYFKPYVSVAERRAKAAKEMAKLAKKGRVVTPVKLDGKKITTTFWGNAWCENLEAYSDFESRLPRGRTYVRNGSVVDLQIQPGLITAIVSGSELYKVKIKIDPLDKKTWSNLKRECGGKIGSLIELLQGRLSQGVMELVTRPGKGLFPKPAEIDMHCSCPDGAYMCKHIAAVLYGVGARLDQHPELLFSLRNVDHTELIDAAGAPTITTRGPSKQTIAPADLADVFGIELEPAPTDAKATRVKASKPSKATKPKSQKASRTKVRKVSPRSKSPKTVK